MSTCSTPSPGCARAAVAVEQTEQEELRLVADYLERIDLHDRLARIHRVFHRDYMDLARALREHRRMARDAGEQPIAIEPERRATTCTCYTPCAWRSSSG